MTETQTKKKKAPGARRNRRYANLFKLSNARLSSTSDKVVESALARLTEMFLDEEKTRRAEIERECAAIRRETALIEKGKLKEQEPQIPVQGPSLDEQAKGNPELAQALAEYREIAGRS
jgi:hypothetical protein